jgi:hypothetical protein
VIWPWALARSACSECRLTAEPPSSAAGFAWAAWTWPSRSVWR